MCFETATVMEFPLSIGYSKLRRIYYGCHYIALSVGHDELIMSDNGGKVV